MLGALNREIIDVRIIACTALALLAGAASSADIYRSTDAQGNVSYSDRPQGTDSEFVFVAVPRPASTPPRPRAEAARPADEGTDGEEAAAEPAPREPTAEERASNCEIAREREQRYAESHRLYRSLPNGEREYLNDAEIDEARARAAADVGTWCG
jgi:hypothetical protein